jgi:hypothetical protein
LLHGRDAGIGRYQPDAWRRTDSGEIVELGQVEACAD